MNEYNLVEEYFIRVNKLFESNYFAQGKRLLEEILEIEPAYGRAHNHLGWLYHVKLDNLVKAEFHLKLAKKFSPEYPASYINLSYILIVTNRFAEARNNAAEALVVPGISLPLIYNELGRIEELCGNYKSALNYYKEAVKLGMNKSAMDVYNANISRTRTKLKMYGKRFFLF
jgi:tetratricopeptide (TPR) repeat protein